MSKFNTGIRLKRTKKTIGNEDVRNANLKFGEPFFMDNTAGPITDSSESCDAYLYLGRKFSSSEGSQLDVTVNNSPVIKCLSKKKSDRMVFWEGNEQPEKIVTEGNVEIPANRITLDSDPVNVGGKYYLLCQAEDGGRVRTFNLDDAGIYIDGKGRLHGAAWNDIAELRQFSGEVKPGEIVCENNEGILEKSKEKLQACPHVVSDTYGQVIGKANENQTPVAIAGRVLVYINGDNGSIKVGDCVCAGEDGKAEIMTRQEIMYYPDRILGVVSEIPNYNEWNGVDVDGRIWINIR